MQPSTSPAKRGSGWCLPRSAETARLHKLGRVYERLKTHSAAQTDSSEKEGGNDTARVNAQRSTNVGEVCCNR